MKVTEEYDNARITYEFEEMTLDKRPQDHPRRDGRGLRFQTSEHGGEYPDMMPQAIKVLDLEDRSCTFIPAEDPPPDQRPQDDYGDGSGFTFRVLEYGGEYDDNMPMSIRVTDREGHSCLYAPITVEGRVVSKRFILKRLGNAD